METDATLQTLVEEYARTLTPTCSSRSSSVLFDTKIYALAAIRTTFCIESTAKAHEKLMRVPTKLLCAKHWRKTLVSLSILLSPTAILAGGLIEIEMVGEPQAFVENGRTTGCGLRVIGYENAPERPEYIRAVDASVVIVPAGKGLIKLSSSYVRINADKTLSRDGRQVISGWMKGAANTTTPVDGKIVASQDPVGAILYMSNFESSFAIITAALQNMPIQVAIETKESDEVRIYFGVPRLSSGEAMQLNECLTEFTKSHN